MSGTDAGSIVGVDVGGTFTDLVVASGGALRIAKVPSTPHDQAEGVLAGLAALGIEPTSVTRFAHGTTVATNTVLERDGARTVLVTTAGFRDVLRIGRQDRPHLYDLASRRPEPLVARGDVVEVSERIGSDGEVIVPLTDEEVTRVVEAVRRLAPEAIAVCLLFGFLRDEHETRLTTALEQLGVPVTSASGLLPVLREVERGSTTVLNAYVTPRIARYLGTLQRRVAEMGVPSRIQVMRSGGGAFAADAAAREPIHTLLSGPAAGAWGAAAVANEVGVADVIAFDVGGTSTDVTLIADGRPTTTADGTIGGLPFAVTTTDIHTIGSGGGSVAWRDAGGSLRVGPRSAGADPGPACYGRGGVEPTLTDANLTLGRLDPGGRLGGSLAMDETAAYEAVRRLADDLGIDVTRCAEGIVRVADAQMAKALRVVSVERGRDPRTFALLAFGGAGPLHQAALADELGCPRVIVPPSPGVLSAHGLLASPLTVDRARSLVLRGKSITDAAVGAAFRELAEEAASELRSQTDMVDAVRYTADLRYRGQAFELPVAATDGAETPAATLIDAFHDAHQVRYGYDQRGEEVELVTVRARAQGAVPHFPLPRIAAAGRADAVIGERDVILDGRPIRADVVERSALGAGAAVDGAAVVVGLDATVWVAPWQRGEIDDHGILHLWERGG